MALPEEGNGHEQEGPVIRDKRRVDPETGELRTPEEERPEEPAGAAGENETVRQELADRTRDLQRVQAEYANYRKRVERDRAADKEQALAQVLTELLPVLDDIGRAREHGELTGGFKSVGESLEGIATKMGLAKYGEKGDEFDPNVHEALTMVPSPEVTVPTVMEVFQPGYVVGERVLRPARVVVAGPADEEAPEAGSEESERPSQEPAGAADGQPSPGTEGSGDDADGEQK